MSQSSNATALAGVEFDRHAVAPMLAQACRRWPRLRVSFDDFANFLEERSPELLLDAMSLRADDLYLVCACLRGVPAAIRVLEQDYLVPVLGSSLPRALRDDLLQAILERLLTSDGSRQCRLAEYSGRASLRTWLRVVAKRVHLNHLRQNPAAAFADADVLAERLTSPTARDPELDYLRVRYGHEFKTAFRSAIAGLDARSSMILKMYATEGATGNEIAAAFSVNRGTVVRWLTAIRNSLHKATRAHLERRLHLSGSEFESVVRLLQSALDIGLPVQFDAGERQIS